MHCEITQTCFFFRRTCSDGMPGGNLLEKFRYLHIIDWQNIFNVALLHGATAWIKLRKISSWIKSTLEKKRPAARFHYSSISSPSWDCQQTAHAWFWCGWFEPVKKKEMEHVEMSLLGIVLPPSLPWRLQQATANLARGHYTGTPTMRNF